MSVNAEAASARRASILLVDDEPSNLLALRAILEGAGDALVEASCGEDALRRVLNDDFAVILLDVQMRGMDGFETAGLLRRHERSRSTPIIFVTAFDTPPDQIGAAYSLGAVDFLVKPLVPTILRAKVDVFVELFRKTERIRQLERDELRHQLSLAKARRQRTAHAVAKIAAEFTSEVDAVRRVLQTICDNLPWDAGALWQPSEDGRTLRCAEFWQGTPAAFPLFEAASRKWTFEPGIGVPGRVWANKQTVWVPRLPGDGNFPRLAVAAKEQVRAALAFPVVSGDDFLGVMEFFSREVHEPDEETLQMLAEVGAQFGQFLQRRRAETALAQSEERMRAVLHAALDCVMTIDQQGNVVEWNPAAEATFGYRHAEAVGRDMAELIIPPRLRSAHHAGIARYLKTGEGPILGRRLEMPAIRSDGSEFLAELAIVPIPDKPLFTGYLRDISDRRRAEKELRASEQRFHSFMQGGPTTAYIKDAEGRYLFVNHLLERKFHRPLAEWIGKTDFDLFAWEDAEQYRRNDLCVLSAAAGAQFVEIIVGPDGPRYYLSFKFPLVDEEGTTLLAGMSLDITDEKRAEESLRESEERFRQLADSMPQIVYVNGPGGKVEYLNRRWGEYTGLPDAESLAAVIHAEDLASLYQRYAEAEASGETFEAEFRLRRADGAYRWFLTRAVPVRDGEGRIAKWFGTSTDIDDTKRSEQTAKFLADASATLADVTDPDSTLQKVAGLAVPHFADWCTVDLLDAGGSLRRLAAAHVDPSKVALARELHERYPPDPTAPQGVWNIVRTGRSEIVAEITDELLEATTPDEELRDIVRRLGLRSYLGVPLAARGKMLGVMTFIAAESGRHYSQADLALAEDLARRAAVAVENAYLYGALREEDRRKDEFLATLAHELRNPLAPIRNGLEMMKLAPDDRAATEQSRAMMERQLDHLVRLVDDLLDVSRISRGKISLRKERIGLAEAIDGAVESCQPAINERGHRLTVALPDEPVYLDADKTRLSQALCNLLHNAAKYTDRGGEILLAVEPRNSDVVIRVKDNGIGIPPSMLPKIFDLFTQVDRSLEKSQGGLGIGLTLVRRLIELHGGTIEAKSAGQKTGSEFVVRLPVMTADGSGQPQHTEASESAGGSRQTAKRRVLVVDDNADAAESLAMMLRIMGNEVHTAHDGLAAVAAAADMRPDLVLLDIGMPKLNGFDACRRIREQPWGRSPFIVAVTGWGQDEDKRRSSEAGFDHHLVKPIEPAALVRLLAGLPTDEKRASAEDVFVRRTTEIRQV